MNDTALASIDPSGLLLAKRPGTVAAIACVAPQQTICGNATVIMVP